MSSLLKEREKCTHAGARLGGNVTRTPRIFLVLLRDVEGLGGGGRACNFDAVESGKGDVIHVL